MPAAIYVRVSTTRQEFRSQEPDLERWLRAQPSPDGRFYRDHFTGRTMNRPGWNALWAELLVGRIDTIVVWRLDRLGRTTRELSAIFDELVKRRVNLVSLKEGLDLATPAGRLMAGMLAAVAQYETEVRGERVTAGLAAAKAAGKTLGRPAGIHTPTKVTPEQTALIQRLHGEHTPIAAIARATGLTRPTVYAHLRGLGA